MRSADPADQAGAARRNAVEGDHGLLSDGLAEHAGDRPGGRPWRTVLGPLGAAQRRLVVDTLPAYEEAVGRERDRPLGERGYAWVPGTPSCWASQGRAWAKDAEPVCQVCPPEPTAFTVRMPSFLAAASRARADSIWPCSWSPWAK